MRPCRDTRCVGIFIVLLAGSLSACGGGDEADSSTEALCSDKTSAGSICRWAGLGQHFYNGDGKSRLDTALYYPLDLSFAPDGRAYVVDWNNHRIRRVNEDDRFQTVMGNDLPGDGPPDLSDLTLPGSRGTDVELNHPTDISFNADGDVLIAVWHNHKIRQINPDTGMVHVICGREGSFAGDGGPAEEARLWQPKSVDVAPNGNIIIADSRNARVREIDAEGMINTIAGTGVIGKVVDGEEPLSASFNMQYQNEVPEPGGSLVVDKLGRIFVADTYNSQIVMIDRDANQVFVVAGTGKAGFSGDDGPATEAQLNMPRDVEFDGSGRLFIADTDNHRVRAIDLESGIITTVAGGTTPENIGNEPPEAIGNGGPAIGATLQRPMGIAFDADDNLFIADTFSGTIRKVVMK